MNMNEVTLAGEIIGEPVFSRRIFDTDFYSFLIGSKRLSGVEDIIPCEVPTSLLSEILEHNKIVVHGKIVSKMCDKKMQTYVVVNVVKEYSGDDRNEVYLKGFTSKAVKFRITPHGREIADVFIAVNEESDGKITDSNYIPCICWNETARAAMNLLTGTPIEITGRLQSRTFKKKLDGEMKELRVIYEVSANCVEIIESERVENGR